MSLLLLLIFPWYDELEPNVNQQQQSPQTLQNRQIDENQPIFLLQKKSVNVTPLKSKMSSKLLSTLSHSLSPHSQMESNENQSQFSSNQQMGIVEAVIDNSGFSSKWHSFVDFNYLFYGYILVDFLNVITKFSSQSDLIFVSKVVQVYSKGLVLRILEIDNMLQLLTTSPNQITNIESKKKNRFQIHQKKYILTIFCFFFLFKKKEQTQFGIDVLQLLEVHFNINLFLQTTPMSPS